MEIHTLADVFAYIESQTNLEKAPYLFTERNYRLDRMYALLKHFGNPQDSCRVLHVAGTKGKGSTSVFLASALNQAGFRTGLYTSPHVSSYLERISVCGLEAEKELFIRLGRQIREAVLLLTDKIFPGSVPPTTFELLTLLAFLYFKETNCNFAVIETGIGGRLDATNVVKPELCLITPVELEHTELLGDTLEAIAREKGGIIKPGVPVFSAHQASPAGEILRKIAGEKESEILFLDEEAEYLSAECSTAGTLLRLQFKGETLKSFRLSLVGAFQAENAALAYLALSHTLKLPDRAYRKGFLKAFLPGRMEVIGKNPYLVIDSAHTSHSVQRVLTTFQSLFSSEGILIFGVVAGKKIREMSEILAPAFPQIIITTPGTFKESDPEEVYKIFKSLNPETTFAKEPSEALRQAFRLSEEEKPILVTGSFYLAGIIRGLRLKARIHRQSGPGLLYF